MKKLFLIILTLCPLLLHAESYEEPASVTLTCDASDIQPGKIIEVGLRFLIEKGWHIYGDREDQAMMKPTVQWRLPDGFEVGEIQWPKAKTFKTGPMENTGYTEEVTLPVRIRVPKDLKHGESIVLGANVVWTSCGDFCVRSESSVALELPVATAAVSAALLSPEPATTSFLWTLLFAMLGGLILNLMPCVLPVISLKVMSFVRMADKSQRDVLHHGLLFTLGVLCSFWTLAGMLIALRAGGEAVGWGFQLQDARFVAIMTIVLLILSLSMLGVFEMGLGFSAKAGGLQQQKQGKMSAFWNGVLATAVATPCTGPFLGPAVGYALTVPPFQSLIVFSAVGIGMSLPYLILSAFPGAMRFIPKPGAWMNTFKEAMGFLMLSAVIWLVWVFGAQTDNDSVLMLLIGLLSISLGCWIYGKWGHPVKKTAWRFATYLWIMLFAGLGTQLIWSSASNYGREEQIVEEGSLKWEPYSEERLEELRAQGTPVFIDFTAKWCVLCQANKIAFLSDPVQQRLSELGVVTMRADWTNKGPKIAEMLRIHGRSSVPFYLLYGMDPEAEPLVLPTTLTAGIVMDYLNEIDK